MAKIAEVLVEDIGGGHKLSQAFAPRWRALNAHAKSVFGVDIPIKSAWRSNARQAVLYAAWVARLPGANLALPPGRSTHNKGTGIDVAGRFALRGTKEHDWLVANGPTFGVHWTGRNFSQVEPWHFDYLGGGSTEGPKTVTPEAAIAAMKGSIMLAIRRPNGDTFAVTEEPRITHLGTDKDVATVVFAAGRPVLDFTVKDFQLFLIALGIHPDKAVKGIKWGRLDDVTGRKIV